MRWKRRVAILLWMERPGISRHFAKLGIIGGQAKFPTWVGPYHAAQDVGQFIGFTNGPIPAILEFFGGHPLRVDDRVTGIIMRPVMIMDASLAVHLLVKPGAWKWREDMVKHQVDFGGLYEIDGALEHA